jgi:predicted glycoside hydrolase/deacetylase ChbG (UPF0249 family)
MTLTSFGEEPLLTSPPIRMVIVNADDFGRSHGINRGVLEAHDHGIVTSASLMTMWPASLEAAAEALRRPGLSVGLHVDLGEWVYRGSAWEPRYVRAPLDDKRAIAAEIGRQLRAFQRLLGADPTHLDSHQHVHLRASAWPILCSLADRLAVPLRHRGGLVRYCGAFYGQSFGGEPSLERISPDALGTTLAGLEGGVTELACHPGYADDLASSYGPQREIEVRTLCHDSVPAILAHEHIELHTFRSLASSNGGVTARTVVQPPATAPQDVRADAVVPPVPETFRNGREAISPELALIDPMLAARPTSGHA